MKYIKPVMGKDVKSDETDHFSGACGGRLPHPRWRFFGKSFRVLPGMMSALVLLATLGGGSVQAKPDVTFVDQSNVSNTNIPVTFGQVFASGDVPAGMSVAVNVGGGQLPTQVDAKATHLDGSLRHAVITTRLPALGAGQVLAAEIATTSSAAGGGTVVSATDLLATSFDVVIELTLGDTVYTASARDALSADSSKLWLEGPLVTEFTLKRPFKTANGSTHPHLMARFDVRAYQGLQSVRVDTIVENNWTYVADPSNLTYDARVSVGGQEVYSLTQLTHYQRARWHKVFWWGAEPRVYTKLDVRYIQATKAVPHYDPSVTISEAALEAQGQVSYTPMGNAEINDYMPEGGADKGIGPLPRWAARYLISGDVRAYHGVLANGDAGGSYNAHYRDINTDLPVSLDDYPNVTGDKHQYPKNNIVALCTTDCASPLTRDMAHQPSIAYLPYLISGDHYYLEELLFWANGNLISSSIGSREASKGIVWGQQVRGQAWSLRTLAQASYITPDAHPMKAYFNAKLQNNMDYYLGLYANNPASNKLGSLPHHNQLDTAAPWMDDFFTWAVGYTVELGYTDFKPMLEWKAKYPVGRMSSPDDKFCWMFGGVYQLAIGVPGDKTDPANWYQDLAEVYLNTFGNRKNQQGVFVKDMVCGGQVMADWFEEIDSYRSYYAPGEMYGNAQTPVGYPSNLQPALAVAVDVGYPSADFAWQRLVNRARFPNYSSEAQFSITPRSLNPAFSGPSVDFSASAVAVDAGNTGVTLSWQVSGADSCTASGAWSGTKGLSGTFATESITADVIYTLSCSSETGDNTARSVVISLNSSGSTPGINLSATPASIVNGASTTLNWFSTNADSCTAGGAWSGSKGISGNQVVSPSIDSTYTLSCEGSGGTATTSFEITVAASSSPGISLSAAPASITVGESTLLTWSGVNVDSCIASGAWSGSKGISGSQTVTPDSTSIYILDCAGSGSGGNANTSFEVTVTPRSLLGDKIGAGSTGLWFLLLLGLVVTWRWLNKVSLMGCRFPQGLARCVAVACAMTAVSAQANTPGLVLHWDFDEVTGKAVSDISGLENNGNSNLEPTLLAEGKLGQAMTFGSGSGDEINKDKISLEVNDFPGEELSLSVWLRSDADSNKGGTVLSYRSSDRKSTLFKLWGMSNLQLLVNGSLVKDTAVKLGTQNWHHLVVNWSRRNGVLTLYKDGVEVYQAVDVNRTQAIPSLGKLDVGVDVQKWSVDWGNAYNGDMDDLRIYSRVLSAGEIAWLASATPLNDSQPPAAPSDLQAVAVSPQESYLRWDAPADDKFVAGYHVYRNGSVLVGTTGDTSFVDEGMTPGNSHNYTVVAFDGAGKNSAASAAVTVQSPSSGSVLDVLPPGHWYEIKDSSIWTQLGVNPDIMGSWSGGVYDSSRDRLVVWGGGHMNYDGNELYAFDLNQFSWIQLTEITPKDQRTRSVDVYGDGLPSSRHTYDGLQYIQTIDRFFTSGGALYGSGGCSGGTWLYDFSATPAKSGWQNIADDKGGCAMVSAYDSATGHVWYGMGSNLYEFDPLNLSAPWTRRSRVMVSHFYMTAAIDPNRRKLALLGGTGYGGEPKTVVYDISNPATVSGGVAATTGAKEIENSDAAGFEFDPVSDRFVAWNGGDQVYTLTSDTLIWSRMAPADTNLITPSMPAKRGTYGRFRYVPSKNLFVVVNDMEQNVFVYKLSGGNGSARPFPSLNLTASSTRVPAGETVNLTWTASDADSCVAGGGWMGDKALAGNETVEPLSEDTNFTLTCSSDVGEAVRSVLVTVSASVPAAPDVDLSASSASILAGESASLNWSSSNVDSCSASGAWNGSKETSGSQIVSPDSDSTYTISCTGSGGSASASFDINVTTTSSPIVSLNADPRNIIAGSGGATLSWSSANVDSCIASGAWSGQRATSGSLKINPDSNSTYVLNCTDDAGSASSSLEVTVSSADTAAGAWSWWTIGAMLMFLFARFTRSTGGVSCRWRRVGRGEYSILRGF